MIGQRQIPYVQMDSYLERTDTLMNSSFYFMIVIQDGNLLEEKIGWSNRSNQLQLFLNMIAKNQGKNSNNPNFTQIGPDTVRKLIWK